MSQQQIRWNKLKEEISNYGPSIVAFSGGVDSSLLLLAASEALGKDQVVAVTADSATLTEEEKKRAAKLAADMEVQHIILAGPEFSNPKFVQNDQERCYYCKKSRFQALLEWGISHCFPVIIEGTHQEDLKDYRPGLKALEELGDAIRSPFKELGWTKADIREMSREKELSTWDLPSAACLASRIAYGIPLTEEVLKQVEEAENFLKKWITGPLRVRHHGNWVRIELQPSEWEKIINLSVAQEINEEMRSLGYDYVTLDLAGVQSGSMNAGIKKRD